LVASSVGWSVYTKNYGVAAFGFCALLICLMINSKTKLW
jgi:hypothetical protein